jgi:hypothetical protein
MKKETIQQILNFIQDSKNDFYMDHGLENESIEVLMPSYLKLIIGGFDAEIIFNLKTNNHYVNNEVVVYSNKIGVTIPAKKLKF